MKLRYVIDTNVLIVASAAHVGNVELMDVTPHEPALCEKVLHWMIQFDMSDAHWILDTEDGIHGEYRRSRFLNSGSYAFQVLQHKWDTCCIDLAVVEYDQNGNALLAGC